MTARAAAGPEQQLQGRRIGEMATGKTTGSDVSSATRFGSPVKTPMNNPPPLIASIVARDVPRNDVGARCVRFHSGIRGGENGRRRRRRRASTGRADFLRLYRG